MSVVLKGCRVIHVHTVKLYYRFLAVDYVLARFGEGGVLYQNFS